MNMDWFMGFVIGFIVCFFVIVGIEFLVAWFGGRKILNEN